MSTPRRCKLKGHDWFPPIEQREFIVWESICLRCKIGHVELPWGQCIGMGKNNPHPLAEHYEFDGQVRVHPLCRGPA